jgi:hypothetical protein
LGRLDARSARLRPSTCHYIDYPIIEHGSGCKAADHEPPAKHENVGNQFAVCIDKIKSGTDEEKAVYMTWLFPWSATFASRFIARPRTPAASAPGRHPPPFTTSLRRSRAQPPMRFANGPPHSWW